MGNFAEAHPTLATLTLAQLSISCLGHEVGDDRSGGDVRAALIVEALTHTATAGAPCTRRGIAIEPRWSDPAFDLIAVVAEFRLVERLAAMLADDDRGARVPC
jgi:hypothetical protein